MFLKVLLLVSLTKLLALTNKPLLCALLYSSSLSILNLIAKVKSSVVLFYFVLLLGTSWLFFWILDHYEDDLGNYFFTLIVGVILFGYFI
jgi:hypothetical protein